MSQAETSNSTILPSESRYIETPEYRRLVYRMYRKEAERRPGGRLYRLSAIEAWKRTTRYVEALQ